MVKTLASHQNQKAVDPQLVFASCSESSRLNQNSKSDVGAKEAFRNELIRRGYDTAQVTGSPADIIATKDDETYYFEIKFTKQPLKYFGAATLTEWEAAINNEERFYFVVAFMREGEWIFHEYTPAEFMTMSYIPPFKIFFSVDVLGDKCVRAKEITRSVRLSPDRLDSMIQLFERFRREKG